MKVLITSLMITAIMSSNTAATLESQISQEEKWEPIGECRITSFCPSCNEPAGYESKSGKELEYGHVACNWLPLGTEISIEGETFVVTDTCGTDAIDIFIDTDTCTCNLNEYRKVSIKK